jgi:sulfhydrogenase subunit beta (sulfur reductase)
MKQFIFQKSRVKNLISHLIREYPNVYAPVPRGKHFAFDKITDPSEVEFGYTRTILPPKKYLMPQHEELVCFKLGNDLSFDEVIVSDKQVIVGVRPSDIRAIELLDDVMMESGNKDKNYIARRKNTVIIGIDGIPDEYSYEDSVMDLKVEEGFDLFFTDLGNVVLVDIGTDEGMKILKLIEHEPATAEHLKLREQTIKSQKEMFTAKIDIPAKLIPLTLEGKWDHPVWEEMGNKCLSCGQCILVCPTCYCFNVTDDMALSMTEGSRTRHWDGCQLSDFTMVGHGENFRDSAGARIRHRFHRKFKYHIDSYSEIFCTGCGRCWESCPADINLVEIANVLSREEIS